MLLHANTFLYIYLNNDLNPVTFNKSTSFKG